jgi:rhodanese-related sulfurtransferase
MLKKLTKLTSLMMLLTVLLMVYGCGDDDDDGTEPQMSEFEMLAEHIQDYVMGTAPKIVSAATVYANVTGDPDYYTILDLRSATDFAAGHIAGATNIALGDIMDADISMDTPVLCVCYTGQSAGHACIALNLLGYDAYSLKFGMSSWHSDFDKWTANVGDAYVGFRETTAHAKTTEYDYPALSTGGESGDEILLVRADEVLEDGFQGIGAADVTADPDSYFILNYFSEADYDDPGHLTGAYQFTPNGSLSLDTELHYVPDDMPVVVYCWTGQMSSQVTFYLNLLGYEAYSLKFGVNGMWYSDLTSSKWSEDEIMDYPPDSL